MRRSAPANPATEETPWEQVLGYSWAECLVAEEPRAAATDADVEPATKLRKLQAHPLTPSSVGQGGVDEQLHQGHECGLVGERQGQPSTAYTSGGCRNIDDAWQHALLRDLRSVRGILGLDLAFAAGICRNDRFTIPQEAAELWVRALPKALQEWDRQCAEGLLDLTKSSEKFTEERVAQLVAAGNQRQQRWVAPLSPTKSGSAPGSP